MRILLVTPPMTQVNTPYPATAYLAGCLRRHAAGRGEVAQADLSLELFLRLFSRAGLAQVRQRLPRRARAESVRHFLRHADAYEDLVEPVIRFLQGGDPVLALRIVGRRLLPEGPRFAPLAGEDAMGWAFGELGTTDQARHLASLFWMQTVIACSYAWVWVRRKLHLAHYRDDFDVATSVIETLRPGKVYVV